VLPGSVVKLTTENGAQEIPGAVLDFIERQMHDSGCWRAINGQSIFFYEFAKIFLSLIRCIWKKRA